MDGRWPQRRQSMMDQSTMQVHTTTDQSFSSILGEIENPLFSGLLEHSLAYPAPSNKLSRLSYLSNAI